MKIAPILRNYCPNYTSNAKNSVSVPVRNTNVVNSGVKSNLMGDCFVKSASKPSFTGIEKTALSIIDKLPLDEKIASIFSMMRFGDMLISAPAIKDAEAALKAGTKSFQQVIKRFIFVPEPKLQSPLAFFKDSMGSVEVMNLSKKPVVLKDNISGKSAPLMQYDKYFVVDGDELTVGDLKIPIKSMSTANLSMSRNYFSQIFDFSEAVQSTIDAQNAKTIRRMFKPTNVAAKKTSFADIGGQDKALDVLKKEIIFPIKYPEAYKNTVLNHGFILYGPPGTGKTLTAEALANEASANFTKLNGLEMESKWVGESEANWRTLFDTARELQPTVIFIDEFDAVAKKRGGADVYGDKVVNQLLSLMSDVEKNGDEIYVVAATNKLDALDDAITRSGRFGRKVEMKAPETLKDMVNIFNIHTKNRVLDENLNVEKHAKKLLDAKATGADVAYIANKANEYSFDRSGVYQKMAEGTFIPSDVEKLVITDADFDRAIGDFMSERKTTQRKPIGFIHYDKKNS